MVGGGGGGNDYKLAAWFPKTIALFKDSQVRVLGLPAGQVTKVQADTLEELAVKLEGVDGEKFLAHIAEYNEAVISEVPFDPSVKDGRGTRGLAVRKSKRSPWSSV